MIGNTIWKVVFTVLFTALSLGAMYQLYTLGRLPTSIPLFDFCILTLAVFRLTRLFVYDSIFEFVRMPFFDREPVLGKGGDIEEEWHVPEDGLRRIVAEILSCPWCFAPWATVALTFAYFSTPLSWYLLCILAIAGAASLLQIFSNLIGWGAENTKKEVVED